MMENETFFTCLCFDSNIHFSQQFSVRNESRSAGDKNKHKIIRNKTKLNHFSSSKLHLNCIYLPLVHEEKTGVDMSDSPSSPYPLNLMSYPSPPTTELSSPLPSCISPPCLSLSVYLSLSVSFSLSLSSSLLLLPSLSPILSSQ